MFINSHLSLVGLAVALLGSTFLNAAPETYTIDPVHSGVEFKVRHFINKVPGGFSDFEGVVVFDPDQVENCRTEVVIKTSSVNTQNDKRDEHLRSPDFFDAVKFPQIKFVSTQWLKTGPEDYTIRGQLTVMGKTMPVSLKAKFLGMVDGREGVKLIGWEATTVLDRVEFGIGYGLPAVGKDVHVEISVQARLEKKKT